MIGARGRILAVALGISLSSACLSQIRFETEDLDLGVVSCKIGEVECRFPFSNISDSTVSIIGAAATCGCTVSIYPKGLLEPGVSDTIKVRFDPVGQPAGEFKKKIRIHTSYDSTIVLSLRGTVKK